MIQSPVSVDSCDLWMCHRAGSVDKHVQDPVWKMFSNEREMQRSFMQGSGNILGLAT